MKKPIQTALLRVAGAVLLGMALTVSALAGTFEDGLQQYLSGDYEAALRLWTPLVDRDDAVGQFIRGTMCETGHDVPHDDEEAVRWYRMAADQGLAAAQFKLGTMFEKGRGVLQDYAEAIKWFRSAAEQSFIPAQGSLAVLYRYGFGVAQDNIQAYVWFDLAENDDDRNSVAESMTPEQIAEARRQAKELRLKSRP